MLFRNSLSPKVGVIFILLATTLIIFLSLKVDTLLKLDFFRTEAIAIDAQFIISKKIKIFARKTFSLASSPTTQHCQSA